ESVFDPNQNRVIARSPEAVNGDQPANITTNIYDERDLVFEEVRAPGNTSLISTTRYDYDLNGNPSRTLQGLESAPRTNTFVYDAYDRRTTAIDALGNETTTHYDANGNATSTLTTGLTPAGTTDRLASGTFSYDAMDRPVTSDVAFFDAQTQA